MKIYAIGDLHLSGKPPSKPMEIFGEHWTDHAAKVAANWHQLIRSDDTVIICGDTSWAMDLQDALTDLNWIAALPGRKIILRGNHDYWWASLKKMQTATENNFSFLQNNFFTCGTTAICGSRGWLLPSSDNFNADDAAIYRREGLRLEASLKAARQAGYSDIIAALHYPPLYDAANESVFAELLERYGVRHCVFGHIHGSDASMVFEGIRNGITYKLVSCDTQGFYTAAGKINSEEGVPMPKNISAATLMVLSACIIGAHSRCSSLLSSASSTRSLWSVSVILQ